MYEILLVFFSGDPIYKRTWSCYSNNFESTICDFRSTQWLVKCKYAVNKTRNNKKNNNRHHKSFWIGEFAYCSRRCQQFVTYDFYAIQAKV